MRAYPLIYTFDRVVVGKDDAWTAGILVRGRAVMEPYLEDAGWWITAVEPAGVSEGARGTAEAAREAFRTTFLLHLEDLSREYKRFGDFKKAVERELAEVDEDELARWREAVRRLRSTKSSWKAVEIAALPVLDADRFHPELLVVRLDGTGAERRRQARKLSPGAPFSIGTRRSAA